MQPVYIKEEYQNFPHTKVKFLVKEEIEHYLSEQENQNDFENGNHTCPY